MAAKFDNSSTGNNNGSAFSLQWSHTIGGSGNNRLLIVCVEGEYSSGTPTVSTVTYNGVSMTFIGRATGSGSHTSSVEMWALWGANVPAAGTYTITVVWTGTVNLSQAAGAMSFFGIKAQTAEASNTNSANGGNLSASVTTLTPNALLVTAYGSQNVPNAASSTGDSKAFQSNPSSAEQSECDGFYRTVAVPVSSTVSLTVSNPEGEGMIVASFAIATAGIIASEI